MTPSSLFSPNTKLLCLLLGTLASQIHAASVNDNEDRWFQIDLVVFKQLSAAGEAEEQWRKDLHLRYPDKLIKLKSAEQYAREFCFSEANSAAKDEMDQFSCLEQLSKDPSSPWPPLEKNDTLAAPSSLPASSEEQEAEPFLPPPPYVLLNKPEQEIQESTRSLNRSSRYRVIYSGSWAQELTDREQSPHILIQGGDAFDDHFELEGHIKVSLERYLHVATDLWLSRFQPIPRQLMNEPSWSISEGQYGNTALSGQNIWPLLPQPKPMTADGQMAELETEPEVNPATPVNSNPEWESTSGVTPIGAEPGVLGSEEPSPRSNLEALIADDKEYYVERTVVLRQQRRMRSDELHYLDHPLFGVLVKITALPREDQADER